MRIFRGGTIIDLSHVRIDGCARRIVRAYPSPDSGMLPANLVHGGAGKFRRADRTTLSLVHAHVTAALNSPKATTTSTISAAQDGERPMSGAGRQPCTLS